MKIRSTGRRSYSITKLCRASQENSQKVKGESYLTVPIFRPVEPACEQRTHPGEGPGEGPHQGPISERFCQGEVSQPMRKGPAIPGVLDGDIHDEMSEVMKNEVLGSVGCCCALLLYIYRPFPPNPFRFCLCSHPPLHNLPCTLA